MTVEPDHSVFVSDAAPALAVARSHWLDAFSRLEVAILRCAKRHGAQPHPRGTPIMQRLSELASLKPSSALSNETSAKRQTLVQECQAILPVRATIVHSEMQIGRKQEIDVAFFQNAVDAAEEVPCYIVMTEAEFTQSRKDLRRLAQRYDAL